MFVSSECNLSVPVFVCLLCFVANVDVARFASFTSSATVSLPFENVSEGPCEVKSHHSDDGNVCVRVAW